MEIHYKDSGIEWIGKIPATWGVDRFKNRFKTGKGLNITKGDLVPEGIPVVSYGQIHSKINKGTHLDDLLIRYIPSSLTEGGISSKVNVGDFIFADTSEDIDGCGNAVYVDKEMGLFAGYHSVIAFAKHPEESKYFAYLFLTECWRSQIRMRVTGIKVFSISQAILNETTIILPPLVDQQRIANYLDEKCGEIDSLIELQEQMIEKLKIYKQSVISEAVTRGLDPNASMKQSGIDWLNTIPTHWNIVTPKAMFSLRKEKAKEGERQLTASQQYGIIYQNEYMELTGSRIVTVMKDFDILKHVESGDFVISMRSFQGGLEYSEKTGSISSAYVMLIPNLEYVYPKFYRWLFKSSYYINALQSTSNMVRDGQAMRYTNFLKVPLYLVPLQEQKQIASFLDEKCTDIDQLIELKMQKMEKLKDYKKSVIYEIVTGKSNLSIS